MRRAYRCTCVCVCVRVRVCTNRETVIPLTTNNSDSSKSGAAKGRPPATPWGRMMGSSAVWAIVVNNFSFHYAFYVVMNWLPTYFTK